MRHLLPLLPKPSRYLGIEPGSVHKEPASVTRRAILAFPDKYEVGMSYLGQKILYSQINAREGWQAERAFAPDLDAAAVLREHGVFLAGMEADTPLGDALFIGFSVTHEMCFTNVLYMLDLAGIPLRASERKGGNQPLILAGGGATLAGEPLAPFVDLMLLGEAEDALPELLDLMERHDPEAAGRIRDRAAFLMEAARIRGIYVPEFFTPGPDGTIVSLYPDLPRPARRIVADLDAAPYPEGQVIPFGAVHDRLALEIARGCTRGCRFCQAGMTARPVRERSVDTLTNLAMRCLSATGFEDISFLSLSTGDFSALKSLFTACVSRCAAEEISLSLPSLRVGSIDDSIMELMAGIRRTGATLAPEAGSQRLRDVINKGVTEEELIRHVQKLFEYGWTQVKLYFMIGLPTETDEDLLAIVDLARKVRDCPGPGIKRLQVTVAVSPFVPKPHTPFQWEEQPGIEEMRRRIGVMLDAIKKEKRITMRWHDPEESFLEGIFSRAGRELAPVVERAYRKGAIFPSWMEHFSLPPWMEAMREEGLDPATCLAARAPEKPLPWDHLENGVSREFLLRERGQALTGKTISDCRYAACHACGVCDLANIPSRLPPLANGTPYANRLNRPERDQTANMPTLDQYGRVVVRGFDANRPQNEKAAPPDLPEELTHKAMRVSLWYEKRDRAAYLSQLELQSLFERALRRANVPLAFSRGFHPQPLLSFSRALPVGVESEAERLTVTLRESRDPTALVRDIGEVVPGLGIVDAVVVPEGIKITESLRETFRLDFLMPDEETRPFRAVWGDFAALESLPWLRETKKGMRSLNARAFFTSMTMNGRGDCILGCTWKNGYISPLALVRAVFDGMGAPLGLDRFRLTKLTEYR